MIPGPELRTSRLVLRRWRPSDLEPFAAMNADPVVMEHFPSLLTRDQSETMADRIEAGFVRDGFGLWAVELPGAAPFLGFVGLAPVDLEARFTPAVEVGWRLARCWWGRGYATEAGRAVLSFGFNDLALDEIVSFTARSNDRSQRVMARLGMTTEPADDFEHARLSADDPLRPHVLYRVSRSAWLARR